MIKKATILIADDDQDYLFQMRLKLEKAGFEVISVETQKEAETVLEKTRPDLAILDLMMENDDSGFILSYKLKKKYPDLPVIISTNVATETEFSFSMSSEEEKNWIKADLYLEKGIVSEQLILEIKKLLRR